LVGSRFEGCDFSYASFDKTLIGSEILENCAPSFENVQLRFARSLGTNYQGMGDIESANKAFQLELRATEEHYYSAWKSPKAYYRKKYKRLRRAEMFFKWLRFKISGYVWGHGERPIMLLRAVLFVWLVMVGIDVSLFNPTQTFGGCWAAILKMPSIAFGVVSPGYYPDLYLALIAITRLIFFGLFMTLLIRRLSKR